MNTQPLSHRDAQRLFFAFADEELQAPQAARLCAHLEGCDDCRAGWDRYRQTVSRLRALPRELPPVDLAGQILRRARRQRPFPRRLHLMHLQHRVPVEAFITVLVGVAAAALLVLLGA